MLTLAVLRTFQCSNGLPSVPLQAILDDAIQPLPSTSQDSEATIQGSESGFVQQ